MVLFPISEVYSMKTFLLVFLPISPTLPLLSSTSTSASHTAVTLLAIPVVFVVLYTASQAPTRYRPDMYRRLVLLAIPLLSAILTLALSYNVTIDDQMGDPTTGQSIRYSPADVWNDGQSCPRCTARPSPDNAYMGTWKDTTFNPPEDPDEPPEIRQASVSFIGTAVYVNCILTGSVSGPTGNVDMTFIIDDVPVGTFEREPDGDASYHFNVIVFSRTDLSNSVHTITIESGHGGRRALVLLDSIIYTKEVEDATQSALLPSMSLTRSTDQAGESTPSANATASSSTNTPAIVGSVTGGLVAIAAILAISFICYRRQNRSRDDARPKLDTSNVNNLVSPYVLYSSYPSSPSRVYQEERRPPFLAGSLSVPTLAPGDSVSQANNSDHTSDWTSASGNGTPRRTFRERARVFAQSRGRTNMGPMKVQNVTEADLQELERSSGFKAPSYSFSGYGDSKEKEKS